MGIEQAELIANDLLEQALNATDKLDIEGITLQAVSKYMVARSS